MLQLGHRCLWRNNYFPSSKRLGREASCQASDVMMQGTSMGSYTRTLIWRFRLCADFLLQWDLVTYEFSHQSASQSYHTFPLFPHGKAVDSLLRDTTQCRLDQRPMLVADVGPEHRHTLKVKDCKNDTIMKLQLFLFSFKNKIQGLFWQACDST